jgi:SEC-C motif domain protein
MMQPANASSKPEPPDACPCGGGLYAGCCGRYLSDAATPESALELMRSRYTAYALQDERYLLDTWYTSTRPNGRLFDEKDAIKWLSLEILRHHEEGGDGIVEFVARYKVQGRAKKLHEISRFVHENGRWHYLDGSFPQAQK